MSLKNLSVRKKIPKIYKSNILVQLPDTAIASSMPIAALNSCSVKYCDTPKNLAAKIKESWKNKF